MIRVVVLVLSLFFASFSFAQSSSRMKFGEGWDIVRSGNTARFVPSGWGGTGAVPTPASTWAGAPGKLFTVGTGVEIAGQVALPVAESLVPVVAEAVISRAGFAQGAAMVGFGAVGGWLGILAVAPSVIEWLESSGKLQLDRSSGVLNKYGQSFYPDHCSPSYTAAWIAVLKTYDYGRAQIISITEQNGRCNAVIYGPSIGYSGYTIELGPYEPSGTWIPASMADIAPYMDAPDAPVLTPRVVSDGVDKAGIDPFGGADPNQVAKVSGPASVPGPSKTTVSDTRVSPGTTNEVPPGTSPSDPATKTTTQTQSQKLTYKDNTVTSSTVINNTTNITNNITNETNTVNNTQETKQDDQKQDSANDTPLGDIPKLYDRKYPNGIKGIWETKSASLKQTSLFTFVDSMMPKYNSGSCPSWHVDLNLAVWANYGTADLSPSCDLWAFAKIVIIISALLLARALIFGG